MTRAIYCCILICLLCLAGGCAARPGAPAGETPRLQAFAGMAGLSLEQIEPHPLLPPPAAQHSADPAPLEAIELFARARSAMLSGHPHTAIAHLEAALRLDPDSFHLHYALGEARATAEPRPERAVESFERAALLNPNNFDTQLNLARLHLAQDRRDEAILRLRLAMQTDGYRRREAGAAVVDLMLARVLHQAGYDRAALDAYNRLMLRLQQPGLAIRSQPELAPLLAAPEILLMETGLIFEKHGLHEEALQAYRAAAAAAPLSVEIQSARIRALLALNRHPEATAHAADLVVRLRANPESLDLLREVYQVMGREAGMADELLRLYASRPRDHAILFAATDALRTLGRQEDAERLLRQAVRDSRGDVEVARRLFELYDAQDDVPAAAQVLVEALALRPHTLRELAPLWETLLRPSRRSSLRLSMLQRLEVPPEAQASRLFWMSRLAEVWHRDLHARTALEAAVQHEPVFAPAYRVLLGQIWARDDITEQEKLDLTVELAERAKQGGDAALAAELHAMSMLNRGLAAEAIEAFAESRRLGGNAPELYLNFATALQMLNEHARTEQMLWKLVSDYPFFEEAYGALFGLYMSRGSIEQAMKVLNTWLEADPNSIEARLLQAGMLVQARRADAAVQLVHHLFRAHPDDPQVLSVMQTLYAQGGQIEQFVQMLEQERRSRPQNHAALEFLIGAHAAQGRMEEARRVLEQTRQVVREDPDLLYYIAHLFGRIGEREMMEQVLEEVVRLDPSHAAASNDLGYTWADEGRRLDEAEHLVRVAVEAEPDNQSFLDSLGWVLYKRGEFEEALRYLEKAVGPALRPDPVVLDHLGDAFYRLDRRDEAVAQWQRAMQRLEQMHVDREDLRTLRQELERKLRQHEQGQTVEVAPTADAPRAAQVGGE